MEPTQLTTTKFPANEEPLAAYRCGRSEEMVGRALEGVEERRYVLTKASLGGPGRRITHSFGNDVLELQARAR
jgi:hypothetical protein